MLRQTVLSDIYLPRSVDAHVSDVRDLSLSLQLQPALPDFDRHGIMHAFMSDYICVFMWTWLSSVSGRHIIMYVGTHVRMHVFMLVRIYTVYVYRRTYRLLWLLSTDSQTATQDKALHLLLAHYFLNVNRLIRECLLSNNWCKTFRFVYTSKPASWAPASLLGRYAVITSLSITATMIAIIVWVVAKVTTTYAWEFYLISSGYRSWPATKTKHSVTHSTSTIRN